MSAHALFQRISLDYHQKLKEHVGISTHAKSTPGAV